MTLGVRKFMFLGSKAHSISEGSVDYLPVPADITKPLSRASVNAYNFSLKAYKCQQRKLRQKKFLVMLAQFSVYYYRLPSIAKQHGNILYSSSLDTTSTSASILTRPGQGSFYRNSGSSLFRHTRSGLVAYGSRHLSTFTRARRQASNARRNASQVKQGRRKFSSIFTLTAIAIIFFGVVMRYDYDEYDDSDDDDDNNNKNNKAAKTQLDHKRGAVIRPTNILLYIYSRLPLNAISRIWGRFNSYELPEWLREPGFKFYARVFGVNLEEMKDPNLKHYHNLSEFFYRTIRPETRPIDPNAQLCSPCDGRIIKMGLVKNGEIEQVKGMTYSVEALLGTTNSKKLAEPVHAINYPIQSLRKHDEIAARFLESYNEHDHSKHVNQLVNYEREGDKSLYRTTLSQIIKIGSKLYQPHRDNTHRLYYAVIYLDPGDYHHFHSPTNWVATTRRHFAGELYSVAPYFQRTFNNLFVLNERVALLGYWRHGFFSMTPVGATNVGSIKVNFDKDLSTNISYKNMEYPEVKNSNTSLIKRKKVRKNTCYEANYSKASELLEGQPLFKGEEMGGFMLGSTIVLCFEAPASFEFKMKEGDHVNVGQRFGYISD